MHDALGPVVPTPGVYIVDEPVSGININNALRVLVAAGLKFVPGVGSLLIGLVLVLWPSDNAPGLIWEGIEGKVKAVCAELIDDNNAKNLRNHVQGLYNVLHLYLEQSDPGQKAAHFTNLVADLALLEPEFLNDESPWLSLQYLVPLETLHLSILWSQYMLYREIYGLM